ncbi:MAG: 3-phosphoserine/phosphohydroxythreonine transaminase [Burkholderiaceae bacterium]|nr:3-phosphoserine/phosphohydroxythreonine transaminase [Burkholderiaceae bacterium]
MTRKFNFSAGPAALPEEVLQQVAAEMLDWRGNGLSVMEMSHRSPEFGVIMRTAQQDLRDLLAIPSNYRILFMQGGAIAQNAIVPLNLVGRKKKPATIDFVHTGHWSGRSVADARKYGNVNVAATSQSTNFTTIPPRQTWKLSPDAAYVHVCTNETVHGVEFHFTPEVGTVPLVADMSSHILSRTIDVTKYGVIFAGAQKNMGIAGLTVVVVRDDLVGHALPCCPSAFDWKNVADNDSMFNTPPTFAIYLAGLVFQWLKRQGGVAAIEQRNIAKAALLYDVLDSTDFYRCPVARDCRSRMNVPFFLRDESLEDAFLNGAAERGLVQLRGHRSIGGMRASIYNAMPTEGVQALVEYLREFETRYG